MKTETFEKTVEIFWRQQKPQEWRQRRQIQAFEFNLQFQYDKKIQLTETENLEKHVLFMSERTKLEASSKFFVDLGRRAWCNNLSHSMTFFLWSKLPIESVIDKTAKNWLLWFIHVSGLADPNSKTYALSKLYWKMNGRTAHKTRLICRKLRTDRQTGTKTD